MTTYASYPLGLSQSDFPIKSKPLRVAIVTDHERCPECGGMLDTGNECNDCGFDAMPECRHFVIPTK